MISIQNVQTPQQQKLFTQLFCDPRMLINKYLKVYTIYVSLKAGAIIFLEKKSYTLLMDNVIKCRNKQN